MKLLIAAAALAAMPALASDAPYAGQQDRPVASLSADDMAALLSGEGWGLAKPAELNGWPGPRHVLDLATELELTSAQVQEVQSLFDAMNARARAFGGELIDRERALDKAFEEGDIDQDRLNQLLAASEAARSALRQTHLAAHLATAPILTGHQRMTYAKLRGYNGAESGHSDHNGHN